MSTVFKYKSGQIVTPITLNFNGEMYEGDDKPWDNTDSMLGKGAKLKGGDIALILDRSMFDVARPSSLFYKVLTHRGIGWVHEKWIKKC